MNLSWLDLVLWAAGALTNAALMAVLMIKRRRKDFPVFTAYIGFHAVLSPFLYLFYGQKLWVWYARVYWTSAFCDFALQLGVISEVARIALHREGSWDRDAKRQLIIWGAAGILLAAALAWFTTPPDSNLFGTLKIRAFLFTGVLVCELFVLIVRTSNRLGLGWRNHVTALVYGWSAWAFAGIAVDWLHGHFGADRYFNRLEELPRLIYLAALCYWIIQFWFDEPLSKPIPPELRESMLDLHSQIKNDLDKVNAQR